MFIGERRTKKTPIRSRLLGLLIVDRVSRKPQEKTSGKSVIERERRERIAKWRMRDAEQRHQNV
jgi:hypothetical protein